MPQFTATDTNGGLDIVRCAPGQAEQLAATIRSHPQAYQVFDRDEIGELYYAVSNRLGRHVLLPATRPLWVGQMEDCLYSHPYEISRKISHAASSPQLLDALAAEASRVRALAEDGWNLVIDENGGQLLVDTHRPDEPLTAADLP